MRSAQAAWSRRQSMHPGRSRISRSDISIAAVCTFLPDSQRGVKSPPALAGPRGMLLRTDAPSRMGADGINRASVCRRGVIHQHTIDPISTQLNSAGASRRPLAAKGVSERTRGRPFYLNPTRRGRRGCRSKVTYVGPSSFFTTIDPLEMSMLVPSMLVARFAFTSVTGTLPCGMPDQSATTTSLDPSSRIAYRLVGSRSRKPLKARSFAKSPRTRTLTAAGLSV